MKIGKEVTLSKQDKKKIKKALEDVKADRVDGVGFYNPKAYRALRKLNKLEW